MKDPVWLIVVPLVLAILSDVVLGIISRKRNARKKDGFIDGDE